MEPVCTTPYMLNLKVEFKYSIIQLFDIYALNEGEGEGESGRQIQGSVLEGEGRIQLQDECAESRTQTQRSSG